MFFHYHSNYIFTFIDNNPEESEVISAVNQLSPSGVRISGKLALKIVLQDSISAGCYWANDCFVAHYHCYNIGKKSFIYPETAFTS